MLGALRRLPIALTTQALLVVRTMRIWLWQALRGVRGSHDDANTTDPIAEPDAEIVSSEEKRASKPRRKLN